MPDNDPIAQLLAQLSQPNMAATPPFVPQQSAAPKFGIADALFMAFNPHAMNLYQNVMGMRQQQEDRQFRQQQMQYQQERQRRADLLDLFALEDQLRQRKLAERTAGQKEKMGLYEAGAVKGNPQNEAVLDSLFGKPTDPRMEYTARDDSTYYLPTQKEQQAKALALKSQERQAAIQDEIAKKKALHPFEMEQKKAEADIYLGRKGAELKMEQPYKDQDSERTAQRQAEKEAREQAEKDREATTGYQTKLRQAEALLEQATGLEEEAKAIKTEDPRRYLELLNEARNRRDQAQLLRAEGRAKKRSLKGRGASAAPAPTASSPSTPKTISRAAFEAAVMSKFGGDRARAEAEARRRGYVIQD
jgi:hypothetical protein